MKTHELKSLHKYFQAVLDNVKLFEIRKNDRNFRVLDVLLLKEISEDGVFTGREMMRRVVYITDYCQNGDYVVMGLSPFDVGVLLREDIASLRSTK